MQHCILKLSAKIRMASSRGNAKGAAIDVVDDGCGVGGGGVDLRGW